LKVSRVWKIELNIVKMWQNTFFTFCPRGRPSYEWSCSNSLNDFAGNQLLPSRFFSLSSWK
jgi:hypothetical protein